MASGIATSRTCTKDLAPLSGRSSNFSPRSTDMNSARALTSFNSRLLPPKSSQPNSGVSFQSSPQLLQAAGVVRPSRALDTLGVVQ